MGHAENDFLHAEMTAALDDLFQRRNGGFRAIQAETLGADKAVGGEFLKTFRLDQLVENGFLAFGGERSLACPAPRCGAAASVFLLGTDVHEFIADAPVLGAPEDIHLARGGGLHPHHAGDIDGLVHLRVMEAVEIRFELGCGWRGVILSGSRSASR